jgi:YegS/Rv2252/BmrU family lipid kinase
VKSETPPGNPHLPPSGGIQGGVKTIAVILNGICLKKKLFYSKILPALQTVAAVSVHETRTRHDAVTLASKAVEKRCDVLFAAGGDGTLNQVVNGMLAGNESSSALPVLGLIPLGSGNDFARTVNIKPQASLLLDLLRKFKPKPVDVGRITFTREVGTPVCYFINIADVGMGPEVVRRVLNSGRAFGTTLTYYSAILRTFASYKPAWVAIQAPGWQWEGKIRSVAIANGRFFGSGIGIAPNAKPDDGTFTCFIGGNVSAVDFLLQQGRMRNGRRVIHPEIHYRDASGVELNSDSRHAIEADGELVGTLPVKIDLLPGKLKLLW